jgi:geranylgeranyl pyrophosphate synthase
MSEEHSCQLDFEASLAQKADVVNSCLVQLVHNRPEIRNRLLEAIKYVLDTPGKRIRSAIVLWCCELVSGSINTDAEAAAAAIEMVHTYSLVHDDLPAMDDDDMRRGKASCHKAFDEATAILTGDALLTMAFEVLAEEVEKPETAVRLIKTLSSVSGPEGMIAGQMADFESENVEGNENLLQHIHMNKTAKMFAGAAAMGGIAGGASDEQIVHLLEYGLKVGLCFQVADDILDVSGTSKHLGKTAGKDAEQGKITYPKIVGIEKSREIAEKLTGEAIAALESFGAEADTLRQLAQQLLERTR